MTEKEKKTILDMRAAGKQYKEISAELGIEISALKVFVHRQKHNDVRRCEQCKKVLPKDARKGMGVWASAFPLRLAGSVADRARRQLPLRIGWRPAPTQAPARMSGRHTGTRTGRGRVMHCSP